MTRDDTYWVDRCLKGDADAFGALVDRYQGAVYATAYYYVGRYGAAEDIAQDAFFEAYRSLRQLKEPDRFGPWLKGIASRTAANWLRKNGKRLLAETPLPIRRTVSIEDAREGPRTALERHERLEGIRKAIDTLPEAYRLPVILRHLQELSYDEIAAFTGQSRDEVRGVLQRAGRQLRQILTEEDENCGEAEWPHART